MTAASRSASALGVHPPLAPLPAALSDFLIDAPRGSGGGKYGLGALVVMLIGARGLGLEIPTLSLVFSCLWCFAGTEEFTGRIAGGRGCLYSGLIVFMEAIAS